MKFVLFLATIPVGQSIYFASDADRDINDGIMPEMGVRTGEINASFTVAELLGETSAKRSNTWSHPDPINVCFQDLPHFNGQFRHSVILSRPRPA